MRKLREAAVVAAMVGTVSMLGVGVADAGVNCEQDNGDNTVTNNTGTITLTSLLGTVGDSDSSAAQQICGIDNDDNENGAGDAAGGAGAGVGTSGSSGSSGASGTSGE